MNNYKETNKIKEVTESEDWYSITRADGMCCGLKKSYGVIPKKGDEITVHTKGGAFGTIRGIDINGIPVFWKTDEELEAARQKWLTDNENKKQQDFIDNKEKLDSEYDALPDFFKQRIDKFRANNARFRIDYESYELFCCTQAVLIADACKIPEAVQDFKGLEWSKQMELVPGLSDGHSGNTFGCAVSLAYHYLSNPENVVKVSGALSPLVGSSEYGG